MKYRFSNSKIHLFVLKSHLFWNKRLENLNNLLQTIYYPKWISVNCRESKNWREESIFYWIFCLAQIYLYFCFKTAVDQWSIVLFLIRGSFTETWDPRVISLDFVLLKWGGNLGNYLSSKKKKWHVIGRQPASLNHGFTRRASRRLSGKISSLLSKANLGSGTEPRGLRLWGWGFTLWVYQEPRPYLVPGSAHLQGPLPVHRSLLLRVSVAHVCVEG